MKAKNSQLRDQLYNLNRENKTKQINSEGAHFLTDAQFQLTMGAKFLEFQEANKQLQEAYQPSHGLGNLLLPAPQ